jgi:hypothetical protein
MKTTTIPRGLTQEEAESELHNGTANGLKAADGRAANRLTHLSLVHKARVSQLTRSVTILTAQYGATSPQVVKAKAAIKGTEGIVARVELVKQQTTATAPTVSPTGWAVWGIVHDANAKPLSGHCVFLVDEHKSYLSAFGFVYTDSTGAFTITVAGTATGTEQKTETAPVVFLSVTNAKAQPVYLGDSALELTIGSALYVDVALPVGEPALGDLPEEIRRVAQPPAQGKP